MNVMTCGVLIVLGNELALKFDSKFTLSKKSMNSGPTKSMHNLYSSFAIFHNFQNCGVLI
jgi:hypothetical protein